MGRRRSINGLRFASTEQRSDQRRIFAMAMKEGADTGGKIANPRGLPLATSFAVDPADNVTGYKSFRAGSFSFRRDEYFAYVTTPMGFHTMPVDAFLRALMR